MTTVPQTDRSATRRRPDSMRDLERRMVAHLAAGGTTDLGQATMHVSPREYTDPARLEAEKRELFGKLPLLACLSQDVAKPGDMMIFDEAGPAILVVRGQDGKARAFLNMCTHRAARLVHACQQRKLITCPSTPGRSTSRAAWSPSRERTGSRAWIGPPAVSFPCPSGNGAA